MLVATFRLLLSERSIERERLLAFAGAGVADQKYCRATVNTWVELGLFQRSEEEKISIHPQIPSKLRREESLAGLARTRALAPENNERFWETEKSRSADFTRAICWLLAQDVYEAEYSSWDSVEQAIKKQVPRDEGFFGQNNTRWNGLKAWTPYFGFGWTGKFPKAGTLITDPAVAIRDALPSIFGRRSTLPADEFLDGLSNGLPVLDGGVYRQAVEAKLREHQGSDAWAPPPAGQLSTATSRAILRLISNGALVGEKRADAPQRVRLTGRNRLVVEEYSHLSLKPEGPAA